MRAATNNQNENRVLVHMPTGRDGSLVCATLENFGIAAGECGKLEDLVSGINNGAGAVLIAEEALEDNAVSRLIETVDTQPIWSDLPMVLFSSNSRNAEALLEALGNNFNITVVERPIRVTMLISAVRAALRARERQYQTRDLLLQLEQADRQKDLFLATLSHELRTPLNSILGWLQILRSGALAGSDTGHALDVIERNAKTQSEMISDILFVSRVITGKLELKRVPLNVTSVIEAAIDVIRPAADEKSIVLSFDPGPDANLFIEGDKERLQQVYLNLLTNAVKFTPAGGRIAIFVRPQGANVEVEIRDNGQGIDPEFLPFVFERFVQADSTYTRRSGGLGLGLAIVRHLVELHGGSITASSKGENQGATFVVSLPLAARLSDQISASQNSAAGSRSGPGSALQGVRALLAEDDDDSREMLETILRFHGVETISVSTAAEALAEFRQSPPDILISDVGMPGENGYDLIRKVRALPDAEGGRVPAIALTGYVSVQDRTLALNAGFQEHIPKPVDTEKLFDLVARLTARSNLKAGEKAG